MGRKWERTFATNESDGSLKRDDDGNPVIVGIKDPPILFEFEQKLEAAKAAADPVMIAYWTKEYTKAQTEVVEALEAADVASDDIGPGGVHGGLIENAEEAAAVAAAETPEPDDDAGEQPNISWSRKALDEFAKSVGVEGADKLPNKSEVLKSIHNAQEKQTA